MGRGCGCSSGRYVRPVFWWLRAGSWVAREVVTVAAACGCPVDSSVASHPFLCLSVLLTTLTLAAQKKASTRPGSWEDECVLSKARRGVSVERVGGGLSCLC